MNKNDKNSHKWYNGYPKAGEPCKHGMSELEVLNLKDEGKRYLEAEASLFQMKQSKSKDSELTWLRTALTQGTSSDKVAAAVVFIQDNPKYNLTRLVSLISQVRSAKHNQQDTVVNALKDLFLSELLHPQFKLLKFEDQALNKIDDLDIPKNKLLAHWYFEDQLCEQYERFIMSLGGIASDTVEAAREKTISVMTDLLIGSADQEQKLLELIVNKIGDPCSKVASKAVFCLNKLLREHPNMKRVVLKETERLLFRKNIAPRAQYYAICLLTQFILNKGDEELAASLIEVYFAFFKACLKKGEPDSRMSAAILMGVNRAFPFAKMDTATLNEHIDSVYKIVHVGTLNVSLNALTLLYQVTGKDMARSNRFYSTFYRKMLDPQIGVASKRAMFLNLLYRVLQNDHSVLRVRALMKRILQVTLYFPADMACATLYIVSKVLQSRKNFKSIMLKIKNTVKAECSVPNKENVSSDSEESSAELQKSKSKSEEFSIITNIVVSESNQDNEDETKIDDIKVEVRKTEYDPFCRNPMFANADKSCATELVALTRHHHPSVVLFANTILQGKPIDYTGDPLQDLTIIRFLDRYVFKNPKKLEDKKVKTRSDPLACRAGYTPKGIRSLPVDSAAYLNEREERIPVDELYLYRYLKLKREQKVEKDENDSDDESVNSEDFNEMLDKLGKNKDFEELDIAEDIGQIKKRKNDNDINDDDLEDVESLDEEDGSEEDLNESFEDDMADDISNEMEDLSDVDLDGIDDDLSEMEFDEDSDVDVDSTSIKKMISKYSEKKGKKQGLDNVFVSAEKFAEMLEEHGRTNKKHGGANVFSDLDGASTKQIEWERKRNEKLTKPYAKRKQQSGKQSKVKNTKKIKR